MALRNLRALATKHGLWLFGLALIAFCLGLIITQNGLNYGYDGSIYLSYAQSIRAGYGLSLRVTPFQVMRLVSWLNAWPPLYPMILALGSNVVLWARLLDALTLVAAVILTYCMGYRVIGRSWGAAAAALIYLTIPTVSSDGFSSALSETVFTVLALSIVLLMLQYRFGQQAGSMRPALYAAALAALLPLTRYLGLTVVLGMIVYSFLWALTVRGWRRWLPILFFMLSIIPLGIYSLYLYGTTGNFIGTQPTGQHFKFIQIPESLRQISLQLLHGGIFLGERLGFRTNWWIVAVVALLLVLLIVTAWRQRALLRVAFGSRDALLVIYLATYLVGFWYFAARSSTVIAEWRHYIAIYPVLLVLIFHLLAVLRINRVLIGAGIALYCVSGIAALPKTLEGSFWNTIAWRTDPIVAELPTLIPSDALIHTNEIGYLALHLGRQATFRIFGGDAGFEDYHCSDLVYPPDFSTAVFTLFDSDMLRGMTSDAAKTYFTNWASPCGTVENIVSDPFAMIMIVHLRGR